MSSLERNLAGDAMHLGLGAERQALDQAGLAKHGRASRTLVKNGPLRVTLIELAAGGELAPHQAPGPATMQVLDGAIVFTAGEKEYPMGKGDLLALAANVRHSARSSTGGLFLLTVIADS